jgi:large subunit ribosomal protein L23
MSVLKKPIITEKMSAAGEKLQQYAFIVDRDANKIQIKKAVETMYSVTVESVNTMAQSLKQRNRYSKKGSIQKGTKGGAKKAIVTLKKGETIDFYSNI